MTFLKKRSGTLQSQQNKMNEPDDVISYYGEENARRENIIIEK